MISASKPRVIFDSEIFVRQKFGGVSRQFVEIFKVFKQELKNQIDCEIAVKYHFNAHLHSFCKELKDTDWKPKYISRLPNRLRPLIEARNGYYEEKRHQRFLPGIIHHTFYPKKNLESKYSHVVTVNDLIREKSEPNGERARLKRKICEKADRVICISAKTRDDLEEILNIPKEKCSVIHLAPAEKFRVPHERMVDVEDKEKFILYVGDREGYKNFDNLLKAYALKKEISNEFSLICFGGPKPSNKELENISSLNLRKVRFKNGNDNELAHLYSQAFLFVYPSLDEGFGIPPLEAMASGCPTISSKSGSLPEVLGDSTFYIEGDKIESIEVGLEYMLRDTLARKHYQSKGLAHSKKFSWSKAAAQTLEVYKEFIN